MRDAIGQVFALQVILAFVILVNGYMAYSVNYTRAFRVKNQIIDIIEQYEGPYNDEALEKINAYIRQTTYNVQNEQMLEYQMIIVMLVVLVIMAGAMWNMRLV